jgi:hypothetical protein
VFYAYFWIYFSNANIYSASFVVQDYEDDFEDEDMDEVSLVIF